MNHLHSYRYCCLCGRIISHNEDTWLEKKSLKIPVSNKYLCQDCCLDASIYIESIFHNDTVPMKPHSNLCNTLSPTVKNYKKKEEPIKSSTTNAIIVENDVTQPKILLPKTKKEVFQEVIKTVRSQDQAVKRIIRTIYANLCIEDATFKDNILLIGNTGVGKTLSVTNILKQRDIPYTIADCNDFSEVGYIGKDISSTVETLYHVCGKNAELASRGVIILDEVDKLRKGEISGRDVSGESVQEELLTLLTGKKVEVGGRNFVDTSFITFILMGAFDSTCKSDKLSEIRKRRIEKAKGNFTLGFTTTHPLENNPIITTYTVEDLNQYGMIAQLSGRCTNIIELQEFDQTMCKDILLNSTSSKLRHIYTKFEMLGVNLIIEEDVIDQLCTYIVQLGAGARSISQFLNQVFTPALEKIEDDLDYCDKRYQTCLIKKETLLDHEQYELIELVEENNAKKLMAHSR